MKAALAIITGFARATGARSLQRATRRGASLTAPRRPVSLARIWLAIVAGVWLGCFAGALLFIHGAG